MAYPKIFEKGQIGSLRLKNRVVMPAMAVALAEPNGDTNEHIIRYYEERAKGGVGLIITEITRIDDTAGIGTPNQMGATKMSHVAHLQRLADRVHKYGTKILVQLQHPGRENKKSITGGYQPVAPSVVTCKVTQEEPRELTTDEVKALIRQFITGAVFCQIAGMDGVELHAAHGYLLGEFLSPYTNKRTDQYGGSLENRMRMLLEIIGGIRAMTPKNFVLSVRISADEYVEGGLKLDEACKIAAVLEKAGIDVINISCGIYESAPTIIEPASYPQAWKKHLATAIKQVVSIPVIATNNIKDPEVGEALLEEGVCDYIALGRPHLADPEWVNKAKEGRADEINKCIGCLYCFKVLNSGNHIECAVNPKCGREVEFGTMEKNGNGEKVAIVGGGPAGMYAALTLKERGFEPVLFEKEETLGGQLNLADKPILKEKLNAYKNSLITRVERSGVEVRLNTKATVENVKELNPKAVLFAAGGTPIVPNIPGVDRCNVVTAEEVLSGVKTVTGDVVVVGGGETGMETAETIKAKGNNSTILEMMPDIGNGLYRSVQADFKIRFAKMGVGVQTNTKVLEITEDGVKVLNTKTQEESVIKADTVVLAIGVKPNNEGLAEFEEAFDNVIVMGDANRSGNIAKAVLDACGYAQTL